MHAYRIGDPAGQFPVWSAEGARRVSGRWHEAGAEVIYASATYSTAMLEMLAHWNGAPPPNQHFIEITIPRGTSYEVVTADVVPNWSHPGGEAANRPGSAATGHAPGYGGIGAVDRVAAPMASLPRLEFDGSLMKPSDDSQRNSRLGGDVRTVDRSPPACDGVPLGVGWMRMKRDNSQRSNRSAATQPVHPIVPPPPNFSYSL